MDETAETAPVEPTNSADVMPDDGPQDVDQNPAYEGDEN